MEIRGQFQEVELKRLVPNKWNPNQQTDFIFEKEKTSIGKHGFLDPILVREKGKLFEIIDGEHRWNGAKDVGLKTVTINNLGKVSDEDAKQLTIIMNEVRGKADPNKLSDLIMQLSESINLDDLKLALPYTDKEIESMVANGSVNWDEIKSELTPATKDSDEPGTKLIRIKVSEDVHDDFFNMLDSLNSKLFPESTKIDSYDPSIQYVINVVRQQESAQKSSRKKKVSRRRTKKK